MRSYFTFADAVDHLVDYLGGTASEQAQRDSRRASIDALRDLANAKTWTYLYNQGRVTTNAPYATGTVEYDHTGGTYERMLTLTSGSWPEWASYGVIRIGSDSDSSNGSPIYQIDERKSASIVTLSDTLNPGSDIAAGSQFSLYRDGYTLPDDFIAQDEALYQENFCRLRYIHPRDQLRGLRFNYAIGTPRYFTIVGDTKRNGRLMMKVYPFPDAEKTIDFLYHRMPRPLRIQEHSTGTVSATPATTTISGVNTNWTESMVGSVIRLSTGSSKPTSAIDTNPADFESVIVGFDSSTSIRVFDAPLSTYSGVAYVISDPVDIEGEAMLTAYKRGLEKQISINRTLKDKPSARSLYAEALAEAKDADSRTFAGRTAGNPPFMRQRLVDMPLDVNDQS